MACMRKRASLSVNYSWHGQSNELGMASTTNAPVSGAADRRSEADSPVGKSQILTLWYVLVTGTLLCVNVGSCIQQRGGKSF